MPGTNYIRNVAARTLFQAQLSYSDILDGSPWNYGRPVLVWLSSRRLKADSRGSVHELLVVSSAPLAMRIVF